jgi:5-methylcytosine-specific restriction endonuclease McrA
MLDRHVLLLNQNYEPLSVCRARRALVLMLSRKAELIESYGRLARSVRMAIQLPSVLRLNYYVRVRRREVPLTKRNILRRDGGVCQYCGRHHGLMTTDHVVPRSLSGGDSWENLVCACTECNARKGSRTPAQAEMTLRRKPKKPHYFTFAVSGLGDVPEVWRQYLFLS